MGVNAVLLAEFLFVQAVDGSDLDHAVQFAGNANVVILKLLALFILGVKEKYDPDLLLAIEFSYIAQI